MCVLWNIKQEFPRTIFRLHGLMLFQSPEYKEQAVIVNLYYHQVILKASLVVALNNCFKHIRYYKRIETNHLQRMANKRNKKCTQLTVAKRPRQFYTISRVKSMERKQTEAN